MFTNVRNSHRLFFIFLAGFAGGICFRSFFDFGVSFAVFIAMLGVSLFLYEWFGAKKKISIAVPADDIARKRYFGNTLFFSVLVFAAGVGMLRFDATEIFRSNVLETRISSYIIAEGTVSDEPDARENTAHLVVRLDVLEEGESGKIILDPDEKILVITELYPRWNYGDRVRVAGTLIVPESFVTKTGREFDYAGFLAKDGIRYEMIRPHLERIGLRAGDPVRSILFTAKNAFMTRIQNILPEPQSSLLGGILLGAKESLGSALLDDFRVVGLIHIVVLSGYNVTLVAEGIMRALSFFPRIFSIVFGAGSVILFAILTGAGATVVRASTMALLVVLARATGRTYDITIALFAAGFLMLAANPRILVFDPSFQLSFLATLGLLYGAPIAERYLGFITKKFNLRDIAAATVATQVFVLPLLLYMTGQLSIAALPVNLLALPAVAPVMLFGFLAGLAAFFGTVIAFPFMIVTHILLSYMLVLVALFSAMTFAAVSISAFPAWGMWAMYSLYAVVFIKLKDHFADARKEKQNGENKKILS